MTLDEILSSPEAAANRAENEQKIENNLGGLVSRKDLDGFMLQFMAETARTITFLSEQTNLSGDLEPALTATLLTIGYINLQDRLIMRNQHDS